MSYPGKIVLVSTSGYRPERDDGFLRDLLAARIELFCAVGIDAEKWEDALDWTCIGEDGLGEYVIVTTSHKDESLAEVVAFAEAFETRVPHPVQVVHR
jgi:hypothetical protein